MARPPAALASSTSTFRLTRPKQSHLWATVVPPVTGKRQAQKTQPKQSYPGQDYNCRCAAIPYIPGQMEFAFHDLTTGLASSTDRWTISDLVNHDYIAGGRSVVLPEIRHLRETAEQNAWNDGALGAFRRLADQIADAARRSEKGPFSQNFEGLYDFGNVEFSPGVRVVIRSPNPEGKVGSGQDMETEAKAA